MTRIIYNILYALFFLFSAPFYYRKMRRRGGWRKGFHHRLGRYDREDWADFQKSRVIWLHAVSVGEVNVCIQLVHSLQPHLKDWKMVVSTVTSTGMGELEKKLPHEIRRVYYPFDFPWVVARAIKTLNPSLFVLIEAEFWPNMIWRLKELKIPMVLVNARISERSFVGYSRFSMLFKPLFQSFQAVGVQSEKDRRRLEQLGFPREKLVVSGNLKFDAAKPHAHAPFDVNSLLSNLGVSPTTKVVVASSTHAGEEKLIARVCRRLKSTFPDVFLILVPRHFERSPDVVQDLQSEGVSYCLKSALSRGGYPDSRMDCLLVDATGELRYYYPRADVVVIGKSMLDAHGGQTPIEPAAYGKAVIMGPHMDNFQMIVDQLLEQDAALQIKDPKELESAMVRLLGDSTEAQLMGNRARQVVERNLGAVDRTCRMIQSVIGSESGLTS